MKNILITGATSGIGLETAKILSHSETHQYLVGRKFTELNELIASGQVVNAKSLTADLMKSDEIKNLVTGLPALDGIVLAAGITKVLPFKFTSAEDILNINSINYNSQLLLLQNLLASKKINKNASIVFISSISAITGMKANSIYSGTKGALVSFARALALELAPQRIRVNCVLPGVVQTRMVKESIDPLHLEEHSKLYPLGLGQPEDVGYAIEFLLSDKSKWITGTSIVLDGGYCAQ